MKLLWATDHFRDGGGFGYSVHSLRLKQSVIDAGVKVTTDPDDSYDIAVHIAPTLEGLGELRKEERKFATFDPIPGKPNLLFTQVEMDRPQFWPSKTGLADMILTSSKRVVEVLEDYYDGPIRYCPEGVDSDTFSFVERTQPDRDLFPEPFRFLWVNNISPSKGLNVFLSAWDKWRLSGRMPTQCELHVKSSGLPRGRMFPLDNHYNTTLDFRKLSTAEMVDLYHNAHAFVQASLGEGWGLTVTEAMATGLPCVFSYWSAPVDYSDDTTGFPITDLAPNPMYNRHTPDQVCGWGMKPSEDAIIERLEQIYWNYSDALDRGRRAAERMRERYSWAQAADSFIASCEELSDLPKREWNPDLIMEEASI